ncbi:hypothetical protein [Blautia sp.]|uniref:hypothetical protein n=1 Tax=Blautia sp. TaxID=1955243 RepID=UPI00257B9914|nr:hypothetical protein [Blautia sp.]
MRNNKHEEFLKSIRILEKEKIKKNDEVLERQSVQMNKMTEHEEIDLQEELERRFEELFGKAGSN